MKSIGAYYINLDKRKDRKIHIESQLTPYFETTRIDAVQHNRGYIGCTMSHIKTLKQCKYDINLIIEDDFTWIVNDDAIQSLKQTLLNSDYNILLISYRQDDRCKIYNFKDNIAKILNGQTTAGYAIKKEFIPQLLKTYEHGLTQMQNGQSPCKWTVDQSWKIYQKDPKFKFYAYYPLLAIQKAGYSDIERKNVDYNYSIVFVIFLHKKHANITCPFHHKYFCDVEDNDSIKIPEEHQTNAQRLLYSMEWVRNNIKYINSIIIVTNPDYSLDFNSIYNNYVNKKIFSKKRHYSGNISDNICKDIHLISNDMTKIIRDKLNDYSNEDIDNIINKILKEHKINPVKI